MCRDSKSQITLFFRNVQTIIDIGVSKLFQFTKNKNIIITTITEQLVIDEIFNTTNQIKNVPIFVDRYIPINYKSLINKFCKAAKETLITENAGGKSEVSEALSINYFNERFKAKDFVLEMQIEYWMKYKMCDYICKINNQRIGVSVTRAMGYPLADDFNEQSAYILLKKKIHGLVIARSSVSKKHEFSMSVLHIWCQNQRIADLLKKIYPRVISEDDKDSIYEVILLLTVCEKSYIYTNIAE